MDSTSCSSSRRSGSVPWEYDVFLCFRGETRCSFTSHVMAALSEMKIKTFIDTMLRKGDSIAELHSVLKRSAVSVIIFSERFADSPWCLDEVATISRGVQEFGHRVLPVFYNVHPSEVGDDAGCYADMINKHDRSPPVKTKWRTALKDIVDKAGLTSNQIRLESELIKAIVENVLKELNEMSPSVEQKNLIGMDSRVWEVERLLDINRSDEIRVVGLWGMPGIGKTRLAKVLYQRFTNFSRRDSDDGEGYNKHYFVQNIKGRQDNIEGIQKELYSTLLSEQDQNITCGDLETSYRRARLSRLKVFIVLDDVHTILLLEQLLLGDVLNLTKLFALGSRIIVTTTNKRVLDYAMAKIYHVEKLNPQDSLRLFSSCSFKRENPYAEMRNLSITAVEYCKGNPLALRLLGRMLSGKKKSYWESFLERLRKNPEPLEIHDLLRRVYDALGGDEKRMFLDIACFFTRNYSRLSLIKMMQCSYSAAYSLVEDLIDKTILECDQCTDQDHDHADGEGESIQVHDLLHYMAWNIVNEEPEVRNRSRLENPDDIRKLLTTIKGERATEGLNLDLSKAEEMHLGADVFVGMDRLRFLIFTFLNSSSSDEAMTCKIHLPNSGLDLLPPELRILWWDGFPSPYFPAKFSSHNLVRIRIRHSPLTKCWDGVQDFVNLRWCDLSYCTKLISVPDLSKAIHLETLQLTGCASIVELPSFVEFLDKLILLDIGECENLEILPPKFGSKHLKHVRITNCRKIKECPEMVSDWDTLDLHGTAIKTFPSPMYNIKKAQMLSLHGKNITSFPDFSPTLKRFRLCHTAIKVVSPQRLRNSRKYNLPRIARLELLGNTKLVTFTRTIWKIVTKELIILGSPMLETLPEIQDCTSARHLRMLVLEECERFECVPSNINILKSLEVLAIIGAAIRVLPSSIHELEQLRTLDLSHCKSLESLPSTISKLGKLSQLYLVGCESIYLLPELPQNLKMLVASNCKSLQVVSSNNFRKLNFRHISFVGCQQMDGKLLGRLMAKLPLHDTTSLRSLYGGNGEKHPKTVVYPGGELPGWFAYKSTGNSVTVPLPRNAKQLKGITFAVVYALEVSQFGDPDIHLHMKCECFLKSPGGGQGCISDYDTGGSSDIVMETWIVCMSSFHDCASADHVFLWLDHRAEPKLAGEKDFEDEVAWYLKYSGLDVSFRFSIEVKRGDIMHCKIKHSGVSLAFQTSAKL